jgi:hypothetical protein
LPAGVSKVTRSLTQLEPTEGLDDPSALARLVEPWAID